MSKHNALLLRMRVCVRACGRACSDYGRRCVTGQHHASIHETMEQQSDQSGLRGITSGIDSAIAPAIPYGAPV
jgi:hypothetical protein